MSETTTLRVVRRGAGGAVVCAPASTVADGALNLRCRFPNGDLPAKCTSEGVSCTPPASTGTSAFSVLDQVDVSLAEGLLDESAAKPAVVGMRAFAVVSVCYLLYTLTDGAIRMVVLLHAFQLGFSAWQVALMFSLYEIAGIGTNLAAGLAGARWGIRATLLTGLGVQLAGIAMLWGFNAAWADPARQWKSLAYIASAQALCGVAKDLTKLGGKTVSKLVTPDEKQSRLFKTVAFLTGMKNSLKGVGYFAGAACLSVSFSFALAVQLGLILTALPCAFFGLSTDVGRARSRNVTLATLLRPAANVRRLSMARAFLFGSRDLWFEVVLPFYLRNQAQGLGWSRPTTGAALAAFIIVYGQVQSYTPQLVLSPLRQEPANKLVQVLWNGVLTCVAAGLAVSFLATDVFTGHHLSQMVTVLVLGLATFCVVFAVNSSIHSYLIVRYSGGDKVASDIGFYYMSNAVGRFTGTLVSGALYQYTSSDKSRALGYCFVASTAFALISTLLTLRLDDQQAGLMCGPRMTCVGAAASVDGAEEPQPKLELERTQLEAPAPLVAHST